MPVQPVSVRDAIVASLVADGAPWQAVLAREQVPKRGNIVELLIAARFAPADVLRAASTATGLPTAPQAWLKNPRVPAVTGLDFALCRRLGAAPIASVSGQLCIAFSDPEIASAADALGLPKHTAYLALPSDLARVLDGLPQPEVDASTFDGSTMAQNTAPARATPALAPTVSPTVPPTVPRVAPIAVPSALPSSALEPSSESAAPTRAMDASALRALSQQSEATDPFSVPTALVPGLTSRAAPHTIEPSSLPEPPVTQSEATLDAPQPRPPREVPLAHQVTAADLPQVVDNPSTASGLIWDPAAPPPASEATASPTAPTAPAFTPPRPPPRLPTPAPRAVPPPRFPTPAPQPLPRLPTPAAQAVPPPRSPTPAPQPFPLPRAPTPAPVSGDELADALSDAIRAVGAVPPPRVAPVRMPGSMGDAMGGPTLQRNTQQEAREYLSENPPTILEKGPQGTQVERVRLVVFPAPSGPQVTAADAAGHSPALRVAIGLAVVVVLGALLWLVSRFL